MQLTCVNGSLACSSLLLGDFGGGIHEWYQYLRQIRNHFWTPGSGAFEKNAVANWSGWKLSSFAVVTASTIKQQHGIQECFRKLGMMETPETFNAKNSTKVTFFVAPIPLFIANARVLWKEHCDSVNRDYDHYSVKKTAPITTADVLAGTTKVTIAA